MIKPVKLSAEVNNTSFFFSLHTFSCSKKISSTMDWVSDLRFARHVKVRCHHGVPNFLLAKDALSLDFFSIPPGFSSVAPSTRSLFGENHCTKAVARICHDQFRWMAHFWEKQRTRNPRSLLKKMKQNKKEIWLWQSENFVSPIFSCTFENSSLIFLAKIQKRNFLKQSAMSKNVIATRYFHFCMILLPCIKNYFRSFWVKFLHNSNQIFSASAQYQKQHV